MPFINLKLNNGYSFKTHSVDSIARLAQPISQRDFSCLRKNSVSGPVEKREILNA